MLKKCKVVVSKGLKKFHIENFENILYQRYVKNNGEIAITILGVTEGTKEVIIPEKINDITVEKVNESAFKDDKYIEKLICPSTISIIEKYAFYNCENLKVVELSCNLETIEEYCFSNCTNLKEVYLPFELKKIEKYAFKDCVNLEKLPHYLKTRVGKVKVLNKKYLENHLPTKLSFIGEGSFENCTKLKEIYFPFLIKDIEKDCFKGCSSLSKVYLHNGICKISEGAFDDCESLREVRLPSSVTKVALNSFFKNTTILVDENNLIKTLNNYKVINFANIKLNSQMIPGRYKKFYKDDQFEELRFKYEYRNSFDDTYIKREINDYEISDSRYSLEDDKYIFDNGKNSATIVMVGDIMCRSFQMKKALKDGTYDFSESFENIKPVLNESDLAICNLETLTSPSLSYCTERTYVDDSISLNAPFEFLDAVKNAGFDAVINSNNHIYDLGTRGVFETLDMLNKHNLMHTGAFCSESDKRYLLLDINNIKIAILSYCNPNSQKSKRINFSNVGLTTLFSSIEEEQIKKDVESAKNEGAEFIIAYCHWGAEYTDKITFNQSRYAKMVANAGVDFIVGSHPHCLQKYIEIITNDDRKVPCLYSAGNFLSDMAVKLPETRDTLMIRLELVKEDDNVSIKNLEYIPCLIKKDGNVRGGAKTFLIENLLKNVDDKGDLFNAIDRISKTIKYNSNFKMKLSENMCLDFNAQVDSATFSSKPILKKKKLNIKKRLKKIVKRCIYSYKRRLSLKKICDICDIDIPKHLKKYKNKKVSNIVMSTRILTPNSILFTNFSSFNKEQLELIQKNCICVICPKEIKGCRCIVVDKPVLRGTKVFNYIKSLKKVTTIAITGSVGKTSTKEMIAAVLKEKYKNKLLMSKGNSNVVFRVASHILRLNFNTKVFLQEVGIGKTNGNTAVMGKMLEADIIVYTNIRDSHIEGYGTRENIFKEKLALANYGKKDGVVVINYDDPILLNHEYIQNTVTYSFDNKAADYYAEDIDVLENTTTFTIVDNIENKKLPIVIHAIGDHNVLNAVVAYAVGRLTKVGPKTIAGGIKKYKTSSQRQNILDFGKYKVLADCYNSSYDAIKNILHTVKLYKTNGNKLAVIGDIFELGELTSEIHKKIGVLLGTADLNKVIYYGNFVKDSYDEHIKINDNAIYCKTREEAINVIKKSIKQDDLILFKASNGMNYSELIDAVFGSDIGEIASLYKKSNKEINDDNFKYNVFEKTATILESYSNTKEVTIPEKINGRPVEKLNKDLFKNDKTIEKVILNNNLIRIGKSCFSESDIEEVVFGNNLKLIGQEAFKNCKNLKKIILPKELLVIEKNAFKNCKNLSEIYISSEVQNIDKTSFNGSDNLTILCPDDSYALRFAIENDISYRIIDKN